MSKEKESKQRFGRPLTLYKSRADMKSVQFIVSQKKKKVKEKKEMWKVKIKLNNGTEISFPSEFEKLFNAGRFADAIAEAYQLAMGLRVTNKIFINTEVK